MPAGLSWIVRRLAVTLVLLFVLTLVTFWIFRLIPSDPAAFVVDVQHASPAQIAQARHRLGVDRPFWVQYGKFVERALHGDLGLAYNGISFSPSGQATGQHVGYTLVRAAAVTGSLMLGGALLLALLAVPLGVLAASRPRSVVDRSAVAVSLVGISTHPIVVAILLQTFVGDRWHLTPSSGYCNFVPSHGELAPPPGSFGGAEICSGPRLWASHLLLPWLTFALFFVAIYMRMIRTRVLEVLDEPYVRTARAKGAGELRVIRRHALPNAILPVLTMLGMDIGTAVGIDLYIENVFGLPGIGRQTLIALNGFQGFDLPVILGIVLIVGTAIILLNLLIDVLYVVVDPTVARRPGGSGRRAVLGRLV